MIDIEKLQKVNSLALELKHHNLAGDMLDATAQAESMIESNGEMSYIQKETVLDQAKRYSEEYANVNAQIRNLQNLARNQQSTIDEMQKMIEHMGSQFNMLRTQQVAQRTAMQQPQMQNEQVQTQQQEQPQQMRSKYELPGTPRTQVTQNREPHAKVGSYNPGDVSVDKIFYSGSRR